MEHKGLQGVVLDASLLFIHDPDDQHQPLQLASQAHHLLYRLCYSNLHTAILFSASEEKLVPQKESLIRATVPWFSLLTKHLDNHQPGVTMKEITSVWAVNAELCIFLTTPVNKAFKGDLFEQGWTICVLSDNMDINSPSKEVPIKQLDDFFSCIANLNKKDLNYETIIVGYHMKWSREADFLKRRALPFVSTETPLCFFPIILESSLEQQLAVADLILQKPTDEITDVYLGQSGIFLDHIRFSEGTQRLSRYLHDHPHVCVVDPIEKILPLLDRVATQAILQGLAEVMIPGHPTIRPPYSLKVTNFDTPGLIEALDSTKVALPTIVKPQMACGMSDAHTMAVVFRKEGYNGLKVPLPSLVQEYIDHGSKLYKFYVLGDKIFHSVRRSTPNASVLTKAVEESKQVPPVVIFHSLKSLPVHFDGENATSKDFSACRSNNSIELDLAVVNKAAMWLRNKLDLTIFGFDVVVQEVTGDHVIVDVNYFPTFNDVPMTEATSAFWEGLQSAYTMHKMSRT